MLARIRKSKFTKVFVCFLSLSFISEIFQVNKVMALTGGPTQPEVQGFSPIGVTDMVDPFTGDFSYNIPLFDVGGYPVNLVYNSGVTMDQEASWVGLGWSLNPGVINREPRGLPDDFDGDLVTKTFYQKPNRTITVNLGGSLELIGIPTDKAIGALKKIINKVKPSGGGSFGVTYNNYTGIGFNVGLTLSGNINNKYTWLPKTLDLGLTGDSKNGANFTPKLGWGFGNKNSFQVGLPINSVNGIQELSLGYGKQNEKRNNISRDGQISFASKTYTPSFNMSMETGSYSLEGKLGFSAFFGDIYGKFIHTFCWQYLSDNYLQQPAFGYMYAQDMYDGNDIKNDGKIVLDFNREKEGAYFKNVPYLPQTNFTYDIFGVSGQGISGTFRPFRSDLGTVFDSKRTQGGGGSFGNLGLSGEGGFGPGFEAGGNIAYHQTWGHSGRWETDLTKYDLKFKQSGTDGYYEPFYMKNQAETNTESDVDFFQETLQRYDTVRINTSIHDLVRKNSWNIDAGGKNFRTKRAKRNEPLQILSADLASNFGVTKKLYSYPILSETTVIQGTPSEILRKDYIRKGHHISEMTAYQSNGTRYVYGLPAYNMTKEEVEFALPSGNLVNYSTGLVTYNEANDAKKENGNGVDEHYSRTVTPAYAHSFLLTQILSPDYLDTSLPEGPSTNDLGSYTKFNYSRLYANYKWRLPVEENQANFNEGLKSSPKDNQGNYVYGEKEIWYMQSIETKTQVAEFILKDRLDGLGVNGKSGGKDSGHKQKCLHEIRIYSLPDKKKYGAAAIPIKVVHFDYDYSLCQGTPNSDDTNQGKLTLKKVYFTYGKSEKGKLSAYDFTYGEMRNSDGSVKTINPGYNLKGYDRWGNFKQNIETTSDDVLNIPTTSEFPYTPQDLVKSGDVIRNTIDGIIEEEDIYDSGTKRTLADVNAHAWNLSTINLPSGGEIKVDYEADDYAYVQDKKAMRMFNVVDISSNTNNPTINPDEKHMLLDFPDNILLGTTNSYLIIKLDKPYTNEEFIKEYLTDEYGVSMINNANRLMNFKFLLNMTQYESETNKEYPECWDYVPGYAKINSAGICGGGAVPSEYAYLRLQKEEDGKYNPISLAGWNFMKMYLSDCAIENKNPKGTSEEKTFGALAGAFLSIIDLFEGYYNDKKGEHRCNHTIRDKAWVRLYEPTNKKKGGGLRVKKIVISDGWKEMMVANPNYENQEYGQEYVYTTKNASGEEISSGVASYEPSFGSEENPLKTPVCYQKKNFLAPDDRFYQETPICESFFPGASVGYSRVLVKSITQDRVVSHGTGSVVNNFYTAKDFPTTTTNTRINKRDSKEWGADILSILNVLTFDDCATSQAFVVNLNDMHGKQKGKEVYAVGQQIPISSVLYNYNVNGSELNNTVNTVSPDGYISSNTVGVNCDLIVDTQNSELRTAGGGLQLNFNIGLVAVPFLAIPMGMVDASYSEEIYRSVTTTKVVNRHGLVDEVIARDLGSEVSTKNLLYDSETGNVLLTSVTNQYTNYLDNPKDKLFSFTYPAHWAYDLMGPVYRTLGATLDSYSGDLLEGDEVAINDQKAWVIKNEDGSNGFINKAGDAVSPTPTVYVLRSARRNQQTEPMGTVVTRQNPIDFKNHKLKFNDVLNSSAIEYTDTARIFCECGIDPDTKYNPYVMGTRGVWRPYTSYSYLTDRKQTNIDNNTNVRVDGNYQDFSSFWTFNDRSKMWIPNHQNWTFTSRVSLYNPYGGELENVDALGNYSSAIFGYNYMFPVSVAKNARYPDIGFDGVEDYSYTNCNDGHLTFKEAIPIDDSTIKVSNKESHTGRQSIELSSGKSVVVKKNIVKCE